MLTLLVLSSHVHRQHEAKYQQRQGERVLTTHRISRDDDFKPVNAAEMLKAVDPFLPSSKRWSVATVSTFFGTSHPWARGAITCPGGCEIDFYNTDKTRDGSYADLKLVHDGSSTHTLEPTNDHQLIALWASETFSGELQRRSNHHYESFHTAHR